MKERMNERDIKDIEMLRRNEVKKDPKPER